VLRFPTCAHAPVQRRVVVEYNRNTCQNTNPTVLQSVPSWLLLYNLYLQEVHKLFLLILRNNLRKNWFFSSLESRSFTGSRFISTRQLLLFPLPISSVATFWIPLGLPRHNLFPSCPTNYSPRTRSLYSLRPTAVLLVQDKIRNPLNREGNCPCPTYVTTRVPVVTLAVLCVSRKHAPSILCLCVNTVTLFTMKNMKRLGSKSAASVVLSTCMADWDEITSRQSHQSCCVYN